MSGVARETSAVSRLARNGVLGIGAGESLVRCGLDVEVRGRVTQALADRLEGKFGVVLQSGIEGISGSKLNGSVMDVVLEDNESDPRILATEGRHGVK